MDVLILFTIIIAGLFAAAFFARRRFGLLGLALAAGSLLSGLWSYDGGLVASLFSIPSNPLTAAVIYAIILLLPAALLLFHGEKYKTIFGRVIGSVLFALLATAFLIEPLSRVVTPQGIGQDIFRWFGEYKSLVIGSGLILAIVDLFLSKPAHFPGRHHKH